MGKIAIGTGVILVALLLAAGILVINKGGNKGDSGQDLVSNSAKIGGGDIGRMTTFTAAPYVDFFNAKAKRDYDVVKEAAAVGSSNYQWENGRHKLVIKGRENGSRLEKIWLGKLGEKPNSPAGKTIEVAEGKMTGPMKVEIIDGASTLVGAVNGSGVYEIDVAEDGIYNLWGSACGLDEASNSFSVSVDGGPEFVWDVPANKDGKTQWIQFKGRELDYFARMSFFLSWGATSPQSKYRDDPELQRLALALTGFQLDAIAARKNQPSTLWFMADLETVYMWQKDLRVPRPVVAGLMAKIRPYVEECYKFTKGKDGWPNNTPNIQIQAAAILRLGSVLWESEAPDLSKEWAVPPKNAWIALGNTSCRAAGSSIAMARDLTPVTSAPTASSSGGILCSPATAGPAAR